MGCGGNAKVWVASDTQDNDKQVAIKVMKMKRIDPASLIAIRAELMMEVNLMT